jgi:hypothetical protein
MKVDKKRLKEAFTAHTKGRFFPGLKLPKYVSPKKFTRYTIGATTLTGGALYASNKLGRVERKDNKKTKNLKEMDNTFREIITNDSLFESIAERLFEEVDDMYFNKKTDTYQAPTTKKKKLKGLERKAIEKGKKVIKALNKKKYKIALGVGAGAGIYAYGKKKGKKAERRRMLAV